MGQSKYEDKVGINIELPSEIQSIIEKDLFGRDGEPDNDLLAKYLFYLPELIRIFDFRIAELNHDLKAWRKRLENMESETILNAINGIDSHKYRNEQARTALVRTQNYWERSNDTIIEQEFDIEKLQATVWKWKNTLKSLETITKLKISERHL